MRRPGRSGTEPTRPQANELIQDSRHHPPLHPRLARVDGTHGLREERAKGRTVQVAPRAPPQAFEDQRDGCAAAREQDHSGAGPSEPDAPQDGQHVEPGSPEVEEQHTGPEPRDHGPSGLAGLDGSLGDGQAVGDLLVAGAGRDDGDELTFPSGETPESLGRLRAATLRERGELLQEVPGDAPSDPDLSGAYPLEGSAQERGLALAGTVAARALLQSRDGVRVVGPGDQQDRSRRGTQGPDRLEALEPGISGDRVVEQKNRRGELGDEPFDLGTVAGLAESPEAALACQALG